MTEVEKLFERMKEPEVIKDFESEYAGCFLQETASIETESLTFYLHHVMMSIDNTNHDEEYVEDEIHFNHFGTGICGISFDCTEDEFNGKKINPKIKYSDMKVLKQMYKNYEKYLDMNAVKQYSKT